MKLFELKRDSLLSPLEAVLGIVDKKQNMPILSNVLLRSQEVILSFVATDIEIQITSQVTSEAVSGKDFETTVNARKFHDVLRVCAPVEINVSHDSNKLKFVAGKSRFTLHTLEAKDFPVMSVNQSFKASVTVLQKEFKELLAKVSYAMAQQDIRYYLNGVLFVLEEGLIRAVATDGHRLALAEMPSAFAGDEMHELIVPRKTVIELQKQLQDEGDITIEISDKQARFTFARVELVSKLVEGKFPDYKRVIPQNHEKTVVLDTHQLRDSIGRVAVVTSNKFRGVKLNLEEGVMRLSASNSEQEDAIEEIEVSYGQDEIEIGFNVAYVQEVLSSLKEEQVQFSFGDANSSALITIPGKTDFKYVVMPMRI